MNRYRILLLAPLLLVAAVPRASLVTTIKVTTTVDEDGSNPSQCSLREAVKAVSLGAPYGGCPAPGAFTDNLVQLAAGKTYTLTRGELRVEQDIIIAGADSQKKAHDLQLNPLTGVAPRPVRPDFEDTANGKTGTYIVASDSSRIFEADAQLVARDLVLVGSDSASGTAVAGNGGVIYAAGPLLLENVIIKGGHASGSTVAAGNGGAIYMAGAGNSLTLTDVTLLGSKADNKGGAIAVLCKVGLAGLAEHSITVTRSLLRGNSSSQGAGAMELCGNTSATLTASTLSANTSAAGSGALTYVQGTAVGIGSLTLDHVTAAEQVGHVIAVNGIAGVQINSSLLSAFEASPRYDICFNPDTAVAWIKNTPASGAYNAIDNDGSCAQLVSSTAPAVSIPVGTSLTSLLVPMPAYGSYYPATPTKPVGLTDYYLPRQGSPMVDAGEALENCLTNDQRDIPRRSGTKCDIGSVERLQTTARDDSGNNKLNTDRMAVIDVLANDSFGEGDADGPYQFAPNTADDPATAANEYKPAVVFAAGGNPDGHCKWVLAGGGENAGKLEVTSTDGELTPEGSPIICKYQVIDTQPNTSATVATVSVSIRNAPPNANPDTYLRPVGVREISFDPIANDNDEGDGKYGLVAHRDPATNAVTSWGPETAWAPFYPIEIDSQPSLGQVVGASSGVCPGSSSVPRQCLNPPLRYIADNNMSPFEDSFSYRVYDLDGTASSSATVTIKTDAPDVDHGGGAGSLDWLGGLVLSLLGLRRFRRL